MSSRTHNYEPMEQDYDESGEHNQSKQLKGKAATSPERALVVRGGEASTSDKQVLDEALPPVVRRKLDSMNLHDISRVQGPVVQLKQVGRDAVDVDVRTS